MGLDLLDALEEPQHGRKFDVIFGANLEIVAEDPARYALVAKGLCRSYLNPGGLISVSYTHLRAHETREDLVCRLLLVISDYRSAVFQNVS